MRLAPHLAAAFVTILAHQSAQATITINLFAGELRDATGSSPIGQGALLQLVNLGPDGVFNSPTQGWNAIDLSDGNVNQLGQWVSGDDTLLNVAFLVGSNPGDFASAAAFDLAVGNDPTTGILERAFRLQIADVPAGTKLGLRWFPGLAASDFQNVTLTAGQRYGEFTRQASPLNSGALWITGADGATFGFDALATSTVGGADPANSGWASHTVVPEPAAIGMSLIGAAGLALLRRRRP